MVRAGSVRRRLAVCVAFLGAWFAAAFLLGGLVRADAPLAASAFVRLGVIPFLDLSARLLAPLFVFPALVLAVPRLGWNPWPAGFYRLACAGLSWAAVAAFARAWEDAARRRRWVMTAAGLAAAAQAGVRVLQGGWTAGRGLWLTAALGAAALGALWQRRFPGR